MAQNNFDIAIAFVLQNEGGFSNNPNDPGGVTNFGITHDSYEDYMKRPVLMEEMVEMTKPQARKFYYTKFWDHYRLDLITSPAAATAVLDVMVNLGPNEGTKLIQEASGAFKDGLFGPYTIKAINNTPIADFIGNLESNLTHHYKDLVAENPKLQEFLKGWLNRAARIGTLVS